MYLITYIYIYQYSTECWCCSCCEGRWKCEPRGLGRRCFILKKINPRRLTCNNKWTEYCICIRIYVYKMGATIPISSYIHKCVHIICIYIYIHIYRNWRWMSPNTCRYLCDAVAPQHVWKAKHWTVTWYCWWTKSCTTKDDNFPIIYRVLTIPGGCLGFLPSTV